VSIAGSKFRPSIADTNDGTAIKGLIGQALTFHPATMNKRILTGTAIAFLAAQWFCT
jgi:hypothetical protein